MSGVRVVLNSPGVARFLASDDIAKVLDKPADRIESALPGAIASTDAASNSQGAAINRQIYKERNDSTEPRAAVDVGIKNALPRDFKAGTIQKAVREAKE